MLANIINEKITQCLEDALTANDPERLGELLAKASEFTKLLEFEQSRFAPSANNQNYDLVEANKLTPILSIDNAKTTWNQSISTSSSNLVNSTSSSFVNRIATKNNTSGEMTASGSITNTTTAIATTTYDFVGNKKTIYDDDDDFEEVQQFLKPPTVQEAKAKEKIERLVSVASPEATLVVGDCIAASEDAKAYNDIMNRVKALEKRLWVETLSDDERVEITTCIAELKHKAKKKPASCGTIMSSYIKLVEGKQFNAEYIHITSDNSTLEKVGVHGGCFKLVCKSSVYLKKNAGNDCTCDRSKLYFQKDN